MASLLTLDIAGAFDIVLKNRLILRLRKQGWPTQFIKFTESFMDQRLAAVRNGNGSVLEATALDCGAPQGSPISPILAMLYFCPILWMGKYSHPNRRFGYADDVAILAIGGSTEETTAALQYEVEVTTRWGRENAISFAPEKAELIHFHHTRKREHTDTVTVEGKVIHPKPLKGPKAACGG